LNIVNVVVDNGVGHGAPVMLEETLSYKNLFGTIERAVDGYGRVVANFSGITARSLLRASGGYVVLNLDDAFTEPFVWKTLKRVLQSQRMQMDTYDPWALFSLSAIQPEAIPIQTKVIAMGSPWLYDLLYLFDPDFAQLFKIRADVVEEMDNSAAHQASYAHGIAALCRQESLQHCDRRAVGGSRGGIRHAQRGQSTQTGESARARRRPGAGGELCGWAGWRRGDHPSPRRAGHPGAYLSRQSC
jgi:ATP-dependent Lon protease